MRSPSPSKISKHTKTLFLLSTILLVTHKTFTRLDQAYIIIATSVFLLLSAPASKDVPSTSRFTTNAVRHAHSTLQSPSIQYLHRSHASADNLSIYTMHLAQHAHSARKAHAPDLHLLYPRRHRTQSSSSLRPWTTYQLCSSLSSRSLIRDLASRHGRTLC